MKITEYEKKTVLDGNEEFLMDGPDGTKIMMSSDLGKAILDNLVTTDKLSVPQRRMIYRGKNLGTEYTEEQAAAVRSGTFKDLCIGDYWQKSGENEKWVIVDIDYFFDSSSPLVERHHLVIMPSNNLDLMVYNDGADSTKNGYLNSKIAKSMGTFASRFKNMFGANHVLKWEAYLSNASDESGNSTSFVFFPIEALIPSPEALYGSDGISNKKDLSSPDSIPFSIVRLDQNFINTPHQNYWLRRNVDGTRVCVASADRGQFHSVTSTERGVRPYSLIV